MTAPQPPGRVLDRSGDAVRALLRWLHALEVPDVVVLLCAHTEVPESSGASLPGSSLLVRLEGCLADQGLSLPAQLLACGVRQVHVCPCAERPDAVESVLVSWQRVLDDVVPADVSPTCVRRRRRRHVDVFEMRRPSVSRRSLFGMRPGCEPPFDVATDDAARGLAALLLLERDGRARPELVGDSVADQVGVAIAAAGCTACGVCVRACPHDALELVEVMGDSVLRHDEASCRGDRRCIELCPEAALSVSGPLSLGSLLHRTPVTLARVTTVECPRCRLRHPGGEGALCETCRFRVANPFGSRLPPGLRR